MNKEQKIVLEYLKELYSNPLYGNEFPICIIHYFNRDLGHGDVPENVLEAYQSLNNKGEFEVIKAFCEWGLKQ